MKTKMLVGVLMVGLVGGVVWFLSKKTVEPKTEAPLVATSQQKTEDGSLFTSIQDALTKSLSLECNFTNALDIDDKESGKEMKVTAYIKNGAVRVHTEAEIENGTSDLVIKDKKMYIWSPKSGGFVMELPEINSKNSPAASAAPGQDSTELLKDLEKFKDSCKPAVVDDNLFIPPSEVKFQDLSKALQFSSNAPTPSVDQEQLEKMMQQYQDKEE